MLRLPDQEGCRCTALHWPLAGLLLALLAAGCREETPPQPKLELPPPVQMVVAQRTEQAMRYSYAGEISPRTETTLSFRVAGKLLSRNVEVGSTVQPGTEIARLDPQDLRLENEAMQAQAESAQADLVQAQSELERYRSLLERRFISQAEFDRRKHTVDVAIARRNESKSRLASTHHQVGYTILKADEAGVVTAVEAERGQVVSAGQPVVRIARTGEAEAIISVPENRLTELRQSRELKVSLWARPDHQYLGKVREISPLADPATRTYRARISIDDPDDNVRFGMTATVTLTGESRQVILLPLSALYHHLDRTAVWVVDPSRYTVRLVLVEATAYAQDQVHITSGLEGGEMVVTAGVHKLHEGQKVRGLKNAVPQAL